MSAYPQQQQFGGPVYPQHHHQAVYNGYGYAQPTMDPHTFRQYYASQLATLTVNSRPIIQHLSHLASEYQRMSHIVAQCLESHIRVVSLLFKFSRFGP
jgi:pre-mRNA cleavage complex 2 protein Pcf11